MTPEETIWAAAADRLRRVKNGATAEEIWGKCPGWCNYQKWWQHKLADDRKVVADAFLRLWPAEPEPVATADGLWGIWNDVVTELVSTRHGCVTPIGKFPFYHGDRYPTEAAARLALAWRNFRAAFGQSGNSA